MRLEQAALRARTADLELSMRHSEQRIAAYGLLAVLFVITRGVVRWAIRRWRRWTGFNPRISTMGLHAAPHDRRDTPEPPAPPLPVSPMSHGAETWMTSALDGPPRHVRPPQAQHVPFVPPVPSKASAWGEPDLRLSPHVALLHDIDEWTAQGRWGEAILHLESALHDGPAKNAWLLLKLLDLYQQLQEFHPHERVAQQLMAIYRVKVHVATGHVPGAAAPTGALEAAALLSTALSDLHRHWGAFDMDTRFRTWLVHTDANQPQSVLDRNGFERLLTLYALAIESPTDAPLPDPSAGTTPPTLTWPLAA